MIDMVTSLRAHLRYDFVSPVYVTGRWVWCHSRSTMGALRDAADGSEERRDVQKVQAILESGRSGERLVLADLAAWLRARGPQDIQCPLCCGAKVVTIECECGHEHQHGCEECDRTGTVREHGQGRIVLVCGVATHAAYLEPLVAWLRELGETEARGEAVWGLSGGTDDTSGARPGLVLGTGDARVAVSSVDDATQIDASDRYAGSGSL